MSDPDHLWPSYAGPSDLEVIEAVPLADRGLPESTYAVLQRAAARWPDHPATAVLPDGGRCDTPVSRTYRALLADVNRAANALHSVGVRRHTPVALLSPNCDGLITATLAAQVAGIAAPVNPALSTDNVRHLLERSGAEVAVAAGPELDHRVWRAACDLRDAGVIRTLLLLEPTGDRSGRDGHLSAAAAGHSAAGFVGRPPESGDLAALFHTGGTTGRPKLAAHTHANEVADAWMVAANSLLGPDSVFLAALPLFHVNALIVTVLAPLLKRQSSVWAGPLGYRDPELVRNFWRIVERYRINAMSAVPTVYATLSRTTVDADISSLRFGLVGASVLPVALRRGFETHTGVTLLEGYGLTEATCATARSFPDHPRPGSVGQRMPYQGVKAVRIHGDGRWEDLPPGTAGNLAISGPTVFPGYVIGRTATGFDLDGLGTLRDGWLDTGDLGSVDADGFIFLGGRAKDLIIRGGHNIDPAVIEDALLEHPLVVAAAAVGRPDPHAGEIPVAYVTLAPGAAVGGEELRDWAAAHVGEAAAAPKAVTIVESLPLTAVGKPNKLPLRADAARAALAEALAHLPGVTGVEGSNDDGSTTVTIALNGRADPVAVAAVADRYPVRCRIVAGPGG